jgi:hypothetical protein
VGSATTFPLPQGGLGSVHFMCGHFPRKSQFEASTSKTSGQFHARSARMLWLLSSQGEGDTH